MAEINELRLPESGEPIWAGMGNYRLVSPDAQHVVDLPYKGEPPHGDSYHQVLINRREFPGFAWGGLFASTSDSRYLAFSWMAQLFERKTVVVDLFEGKYFVLPEYIYKPKFEWPRILGNQEQDNGRSYTFTGNEVWAAY